MPVSCPCTGLPCSAWVCNEGKWPCDPTYAQSLLRAEPNTPADSEVEDTEDGMTLAVELPNDGEIDF